MEVKNIETAIGDVVQINKRGQHQQRAEQCVQEKFHRRIHATRPAPHTDDEEHRNQHCFEKEIKQDRVGRGKYTVDEP